MNYLYPDGIPIAISLVAYNAFLTGFFVLMKRKDKKGIFYFAFSFFVFLWGVGLSFMMNNSFSNETAQAWGRFSQIAALFIPAVFIHFVIVYTEQKKVTGLLIAIYVVTLAILPFSFGNLFIAGFRPMVGISNYPVPGPAYHGFALLFFGVVIYSHFILYRQWQSVPTIDKKWDYKLIFWCNLYAHTMGGLSFLPVYGIPFPQYNFLLMPLWQIFLAYGLIRYRLFDLAKVAEMVHRERLAAIGTLSTSMNHEIRNPLFIIQGAAQSLLVNLQEKRIADPAQVQEQTAKTLAKISDQATRAMDIMKRFSTFAKQTTDQNIREQNVSLSAILENVVTLISAELSLDQIVLSQKIPASLPGILGDPRYFEEIFFNLFMNACQAIKAGGRPGKIDIEAWQDEHRVRIAMRDNGPGIPEQDLKRIFEPFHTTKQDGTGLGLYIAKLLAERNGGKISVTSKIGEGTTFTLTFPAASQNLV